MNKNYKWGIIAALLVLTMISIFLVVFTKLSFLESLRIVYGSVYVLFIPGFILTYIFFPKTKEFDSKEEKGAIDWIERIALSFALSIAIVPLVIFYLNLIGIKISFVNSFITILLIIGISLAIAIKRQSKVAYYPKNISR